MYMDIQINIVKKMRQVLESVVPAEGDEPKRQGLLYCERYALVSYSLSIFFNYLICICLSNFYLFI